MTPKNLRRIIFGVILFWVLFAVIIYQAFAAVIWQSQEGIYNLYKYGSTNKYEISTKAVPTTYIKQAGQYTQFKSSGGSTKYELITIVNNCQAFACRDSFGVTFDLTKNTVLTCPMVKISNEQIMAYEGLQANATSCR